MWSAETRSGPTESWRSIMGGTGNNSNTKETSQPKWFLKPVSLLNKQEPKSVRHWQTLTSLCLLTIRSSMRLISSGSWRPHRAHKELKHPPPFTTSPSSCSLLFLAARGGAAAWMLLPQSNAIHPSPPHTPTPCDHGHIPLGPFRSLPCRWKITRALIHDQHVAVAASITALPPVRRRMGEINNDYELVLRPIAELKMRHRHKTTFGSSAKSFASKHKSSSIVFSIAESYSGPFCLVISPPHTHAHTQRGEAQSHLKR